MDTVRAIYFLWSYRDEVRDSYVSRVKQRRGTDRVRHRVRHLHVRQNRKQYPFRGDHPDYYGNLLRCRGGYNCMLNTSSGNEFPNLDTHRAHNYEELLEGNVVGTLAWDIWGSGSQSTALRNRISGNHPNKTNYQLPVADSAWNRYMNWSPM